MRVAAWVPIYKDMIPIPERFAVAFGLIDGAELHVAPLEKTSADSRHPEMIVSPVPVRCWKSVCYLSVRLRDVPGALEIAARFMSQQKINVLLSESCGTSQGRARWDAICDLSRYDGFGSIEGTERSHFGRAMRNLLKLLTEQLRAFSEQPEHKEYFLSAPDYDAKFRPVTGLNDTSFNVNPLKQYTIPWSLGAITLPDALVEYLSRQVGRQRSLPDYAMITGNTEQRYLRIFFITDDENVFRATVRTSIKDYAGGGAGVLHQFLKALPKDTNLIRASTAVIEATPSNEKGRIELIASRNEPRDLNVPQQKAEKAMEDSFRRFVADIRATDLDGKEHEGVYRLEEFGHPETYYPRVFVSYSTQRAERRLDFIKNELWNHTFRPVLGTDFGQSDADVSVDDAFLTAETVTQAAFNAIPTCVAFLSLCEPRQDYELAPPIDKDDKDDKDQPRYTMPPWTLAEEVFAWSRGIGLLIRLQHKDVQDPKYNKNIKTLSWVDEDSFKRAVRIAIAELESFRKSPAFQRVHEQARKNRGRSR